MTDHDDGHVAPSLCDTARLRSRLDERMNRTGVGIDRHPHERAAAPYTARPRLVCGGNTHPDRPRRGGADRSTDPRLRCATRAAAGDLAAPTLNLVRGWRVGCRADAVAGMTRMARQTARTRTRTDVAYPRARLPARRPARPSACHCPGSPPDPFLLPNASPPFSSRRIHAGCPRRCPAQRAAASRARRQTALPTLPETPSGSPASGAGRGTAARLATRAAPRRTRSRRRLRSPGAR